MIEPFQDWYLQECFDNQFPDDVEAIFTNALPTWSESPNLECAELYQRFTSLYEVHHRYSQPLNLPEPFNKKIHRWLGGEQTLVDQVNKQVGGFVGVQVMVWYVRCILCYSVCHCGFNCPL